MNVLMIFTGLVSWLAMIPDLRRGRPLPWMLAATLGAMLVWSWPPYRFLVPILPFLVAYMLRAPAALAEALNHRTAWRFAAAFGLGAIVLANGALLARHAQQVRRTGYPLARLTDSPVEWSSYQRTFDWLKRHSEPRDVVASGLDSMTALYTGRQAFRPFVYDPGRLFYGEGQPELLTMQELVDILKHYQPRYLVESPMPGFMEEHPLTNLLHEVVDRYPQWLVRVYQDADPRFAVFELDWRQAPGESD